MARVSRPLSRPLVLYTRLHSGSEFVLRLGRQIGTRSCPSYAEIEALSILPLPEAFRVRARARPSAVLLLNSVRLQRYCYSSAVLQKTSAVLLKTPTHLRRYVSTGPRYC